MDLLNEPEGQDYEHACQLIDSQLLRYEGLIRDELAKPRPDPARVEEYRHIEQHLLAQRESLDWHDRRTAGDVIHTLETPPDDTRPAPSPGEL